MKVACYVERRIISLIIAVLLTFTMIQSNSFAMHVYASSAADGVLWDLGVSGQVILGNGSNEVSENIIITGTYNRDSSNGAVVLIRDDYSGIVTLNNVTIDVSSYNICGIKLEGDADVIIQFSGNNNVVLNQARAGIEVPSNAKLTLKGTDENAYIQLLENIQSSNRVTSIGGISGGVCGDVVFDGGKIRAFDIACGYGGTDGGNVTVLSGEVIAWYIACGGNGVATSVDGGNGGNITVKNGLVYAFSKIVTAGDGYKSDSISGIGYLDDSGNGGDGGIATITGGDLKCASLADGGHGGDGKNVTNGGNGGFVAVESGRIYDSGQIAQGGVSGYDQLGKGGNGGSVVVKNDGEIDFYHANMCGGGDGGIAGDAGFVTVEDNGKISGVFSSIACGGNSGRYLYSHQQEVKSGKGGAVTVSGNGIISADEIACGGTGVFPAIGHGGDGGTVITRDSAAVYSRAVAAGGDGDKNGVGGNGGIVEILDNSLWEVYFIANGGIGDYDNFGGWYSGDGGNGGNILINGGITHVLEKAAMGGKGGESSNNGVDGTTTILNGYLNIASDSIGNPVNSFGQSLKRSEVTSAFGKTEFLINKDEDGWEYIYGALHDDDNKSYVWLPTNTELTNITPVSQISALLNSDSIKITASLKVVHDVILQRAEGTDGKFSDLAIIKSDNTLTYSDQSITSNIMYSYRILAPLDSGIYLLSNAVHATFKNRDLTLTTDAHLIQKDDSFAVSAAFTEEAASNTAILTYTYDGEKFEYVEFIPADGVTVLSQEMGNGSVKITIMASDYNLKHFGGITLRGKTSLQREYQTVNLNVEYVLRTGTNKTIEIANAIISFTALGNKGDTNDDGVIDLIDLSDMIDWYGLTSSEANWVDWYVFFDYNNNSTIDISDISYVAKLIE